MTADFARAQNFSKTFIKRLDFFQILVYNEGTKKKGTD